MIPQGVPRASLTTVEITVDDSSLYSEANDVWWAGAPDGRSECQYHSQPGRGGLTQPFLPAYRSFYNTTVVARTLEEEKALSVPTQHRPCVLHCDCTVY